MLAMRDLPPMDYPEIGYTAFGTLDREARGITAKDVRNTAILDSRNILLVEGLPESLFWELVGR